jgi:hypothetical protein
MYIGFSEFPIWCLSNVQPPGGSKITTEKNLGSDYVGIDQTFTDGNREVSVWG